MASPQPSRNSNDKRKVQHHNAEPWRTPPQQRRQLVKIILGIIRQAVIHPKEFDKSKMAVHMHRVTHRFGERNYSGKQRPQLHIQRRSWTNSYCFKSATAIPPQQRSQNRWRRFDQVELPWITVSLASQSNVIWVWEEQKSTSRFAVLLGNGDRSGRLCCIRGGKSGHYRRRDWYLLQVSIHRCLFPTKVGAVATQVGDPIWGPNAPIWGPNLGTCIKCCRRVWEEKTPNCSIMVWSILELLMPLKRTVSMKSSAAVTPMDRMSMAVVVGDMPRIISGAR